MPNAEIKLSVVIITKNEEKNIDRCINSVIPVADEILIIDSFSTDKTEEIATGLGARLIKNKFEGHIQQKNFAVESAKFDYILSLDADEALSEELIESIQHAKKNWKFNAYKFNRLTNYAGYWVKHSGWYPDQKIRLWHRKYGKWGGINPHDKVVLQNNIDVKHLKGNLLHYSITSKKHHLQIVNNFSNIAAQEYYQNGIKVNYFKIVFKPTWKFIKGYFLQLGILDGYKGFQICKISAKATLLKYTKLRALYKNAKND